MKVFAIQQQEHKQLLFGSQNTRKNDKISSKLLIESILFPYDEKILKK